MCGHSYKCRVYRCGYLSWTFFWIIQYESRFSRWKQRWMVWRGALLQSNHHKGQKIRNSKRHGTPLESHHAFMTKRSSFTRQTVYKTYMEIKKRTKCSIEKYIIVSSFPLRPSSHGTEPSEGTPGGKKQRLSPTSVLIIIATLFTVQQSLSSVRHGKKVTDWMTWYMANRSIICTHFCSLHPRIPGHANSVCG